MEQKDEFEFKIIVKTKVKNRGTGAGGANTNKNGLPYEAKVDLSTEFKSIRKSVINKNQFQHIQFNSNENEYVVVKKSKLHSYMDVIGEKVKTIKIIAGCKEPDEAYIHLDTKNIFIIEKKFQQTSGSVDEKIQTFNIKKRHYSKLFPNYKVHYVYCLSDWFKKDDYADVVDMMNEDKIPVFWGDDSDYKSKIIQYIISNSL